MDVSMLIALIESTDSLTEQEKLFLVKNIEHLRQVFMQRYHKDIVIDM